MMSLTMLKILYDVIDNSSTLIISLVALYYDTDDIYQCHLYLYTDIPLLYIYTSLQTLWHYTMYLALYAILCLVYIFYIYLCALMYLYDDTQARTYILYAFTYAFIWHLLSALHTFYGSNAALLLYDTHIFAASWAGFGTFHI